MRTLSFLAVIALLACAPQPHGAVPAVCGPVPPSDAHYVYRMNETAERFVGTYRLYQVATQPKGPRVSTGILHLERGDSIARRAAPWRGLVGWYEPDSGDSAYRRRVSSRDTRSPGVALIDNRIRIGQTNMVDGVGDDLIITAQTQEGLWGWWTEDEGNSIPLDTLAEPIRAGYFCASRLTNDSVPGPGA